MSFHRFLLTAKGGKLTQHYDDADEDGDDGSSSQTSGDDSLHVDAVSVVVALAHFDPQVGRVRHGQVPGVCDHDGDHVDPTGQGSDPEAELSVVSCEPGR